jgi:DNA-binding CsgD family transcriptional regulator/GAF domain-containing protein
MLQTVAFEKYDDLIGLAYMGIAETKPWQAFVECLAEVAGVRDASVLIGSRRAPGNALVITSDHSPRLTPAYVSRVLASDVMQVVNDLEMPTPTSVGELLPGRRWLHSDLYRDYLQPFQIHRTLLVDVWRDPVMLVRLAVDRTVDQADFGADERSLIERLSKHLANSLSLRSTLQNAQASSQFYQHAMDRLGIGALFLNSAGQLVDANQTGAQLLQQRQGLCLREDKLTVSAGRSGEPFRALLRALLSGDTPAPQGLRVLDESGAAVLEIVGRRLPDNGAMGTRIPAVVLLATACRQKISEPCAPLLRDLYGFTACEARLAKLLVQGYTAQEAAATLCVSVNTIKTHLKGIFEKTGYNKQSQVVAILNNSAVRLM